MNKTVNVNIGGMPYIVDEDAYTMLSAYLSQIESSLAANERREIMEDVENRIADIFTEQVGIRVQVINTRIVRHAITLIGNADDFGESSQYQTPPPSNTTPPPRFEDKVKNHGFDRSRTERILGGICGGLSPALGLDVTIIRLILVLITFLSFSFTLWVYIILWIIIPEAPLTTNTNDDERR